MDLGKIRRGNAGRTCNPSDKEGADGWRCLGKAPHNSCFLFSYRVHPLPQNNCTTEVNR
ncbi:hypothetical protein CSPX01_06728 [Colletotrichum filicis]|nr:hypothetical protein CSPX01_06728 [Colletotrichum filicis]